MAERVYECPDCGTANERPHESAAAVIEVACWSCGAVFRVNQYKHVVVSA